MGENGIQATMPLAPTSQTANSNMFGGEGGIMWILVLFLLLGGRGLGGFGNDGVSASPATNLINNDFLYSQTKIDNLNLAMNNGFDALQMALCNLGHQVDSGFCGVNRNIDNIRFEMAQNTCTITNAIGASTQSILGYLTNQEIANWRERALAAETRENNANQSLGIQQFVANQFEQHFPCARPAYLSNPPGHVPFVGSYVMGGYGAPFGFDGGRRYGGECHDGCRHGVI